jgi:hypothetical protein
MLLRYTPERRRPTRESKTKIRRFWRRQSSFKAPQMSRSDDGPLSSLPEELDRALRRATDRTLVALTSLRKAVRQHVRDERERGATLSEIELDLRALVARLHQEAERSNGADGEHETLATQMIKWTGGFYKQND